MSIQTIIGPMFCQKTTELHMQYQSCILQGKEALLVSHASNTRYSPDVPLNVSHDGVKSKCVRLNRLSNCPPAFLQNVTHIFIDEGQFFDDLVTFCVSQRVFGKHVTVAGLRSDGSGKIWPTMSELVMVHADKVTFKTAVCIVCRGKAMYTRRRIVDIATAEQIDIGSDDKYLPACFDHLFDPPAVPSHILQERMALLKKSKETLFY